MITLQNEYQENLFKIQDKNPPITAVLLPSTEQIYKIDLNKRTVETPEFLSVQTDHTAETVYFRVNRYYDHIDLSNMICVIQYVNAEGEGFVFPVPYYDLTTFPNEILFPWIISGNATKAAGTISYSIRFYRINEAGNSFTYNMSTLPVESKILYGMDISDAESIIYSDDALTKLLNAVQKVQDQLDRKELDIYWIE